MDVTRPVSEATLLVIAPAFLGLLASYGLFGISIVQLYVYYCSFPHDSKAVKTLVYCVFILDVFQSVVIAIMGWGIFCERWGYPIQLLAVNWTNGALPCSSGVTAALVQSFYAWRIHKMGEWRVVPVIIVTVALTQMCATIAIVVQIPSTPNLLALHDIYAQAIVWLAGAGLTDILIAVFMIYLLWGFRRDNPYKGTKRIVNYLIRLTIETGVATATTAIAELICFVSGRDNNLHLFFAFMLCKSEFIFPTLCLFVNHYSSPLTLNHLTL
ncbi:hypothetical protein BC629DRAFT_202807 [Irpex lacteus]|nr:hypothetical protein BC629DRAFT_202807 [Irpex lacteus]